LNLCGLLLCLRCLDLQLRDLLAVVRAVQLRREQIYPLLAKSNPNSQCENGENEHDGLDGAHEVQSPYRRVPLRRQARRGICLLILCHASAYRFGCVQNFFSICDRVGPIIVTFSILRFSDRVGPIIVTFSILFQQLPSGAARPQAAVARTIRENSWNSCVHSAFRTPNSALRTCLLPGS
jgi:hypothetical protein